MQTVVRNQEVTRLEEAIIEIGSITHFFSKINVAIVKLTLPLSVGDRILIKGPLTDFSQNVESIQIDRKDIQRAEGGQNIGLKLMQLAKEKDVVYKKL
jgi:putative protease